MKKQIILFISIFLVVSSLFSTSTVFATEVNEEVKNSENNDKQPVVENSDNETMVISTVRTVDEPIIENEKKIEDGIKNLEEQFNDSQLSIITVNGTVEDREKAADSGLTTGHFLMKEKKLSVHGENKKTEKGNKKAWDHSSKKEKAKIDEKKNNKDNTKIKGNKKNKNHKKEKNEEKNNKAVKEKKSHPHKNNRENNGNNKKSQKEKGSNEKNKKNDKNPQEKNNKNRQNNKRAE